jgi:hypothetical protein
MTRRVVSYKFIDVLEALIASMINVFAQMMEAVSTSET